MNSKSKVSHARGANGRPVRHGKKKNNKGRIVTAASAPSQNQIIERNIPLFPYATKRMLRYADTGSFTTGVSAANSYVFACNGLYDPNITGSGHQPAGFDQMMLFYDHFIVTKARLTATFRNNSTAYPADVAICVTPSTSPNTEYNQLMEDGMLVRRTLGMSPYDSCVGTLSLSVDVAKSLGIIKIRDAEECKGNIAANPAELTYFACSGWNSESATQLIINFDVVIEYESWFVEPRLLTQSLKANLTTALKKEALEMKKK